MRISDWSSDVCSSDLIAQLLPAPSAELGEVQRVPRGTELLTRPVQGVPVRYRTAYPVDVWPVQITEAHFEPIERSAFAVDGADTVATVRIRLATTGQAKFKQLDRKSTRLNYSHQCAAR